jgi:hypothetical protein
MQEVVRSIDPGREILRGTQWRLQCRNADRNSRRENHLGQRSTPHQQAEHMDAIEPIETTSSLADCERGCKSALDPVTSPAASVRPKSIAATV